MAESKSTPTITNIKSLAEFTKLAETGIKAYTSKAKEFFMQEFNSTDDVKSSEFQVALLTYMKSLMSEEGGVFKRSDLLKVSVITHVFIDAMQSKSVTVDALALFIHYYGVDVYSAIIYVMENYFDDDGMLVRWYYGATKYNGYDVNQYYFAKQNFDNYCFTMFYRKPVNGESMCRKINAIIVNGIIYTFDKHSNESLTYRATYKSFVDIIEKHTPLNLRTHYYPFIADIMVVISNAHGDHNYVTSTNTGSYLAEHKSVLFDYYSYLLNNVLRGFVEKFLLEERFHKNQLDAAHDAKERAYIHNNAPDMKNFLMD